jgi:hypothetical protein
VGYYVGFRHGQAVRAFCHAAQGAGGQLSVEQSFGNERYDLECDARGKHGCAEWAVVHTS